MNNSVDISVGILLCTSLGGLFLYLYHLAISTSPQKLRNILRKVEFCLGKADITLGEIVDKDNKAAFPLYFNWISSLTLVLILDFVISIITLTLSSYFLFSSLNSTQIPKEMFVNVLSFAVPSMIFQGIFIAIVDKIKFNVEEFQQK